MRERMTDERWTEIAKYHARNPTEVFTEAGRARASEIEKDATIKALADALAEMERQHTTVAHRLSAAEARVRSLADALNGTGSALLDGSPCWCFLPEIKAGYPHGVDCESRRAALRLAGRLK